MLSLWLVQDENGSRTLRDGVWVSVMAVAFASVCKSKGRDGGEDHCFEEWMS